MPGPDAPPSPAPKLLRALRGEAFDPPPWWLMRQAGRYLPEYRALRAKAGGFLEMVYDPDLATEITVQPLRRFGMSAAILFSDILVVPHALGQRLQFAAGEGPILEPIRDAAGLAALDPTALEGRTAPVAETVRRVRAALPPETALIGFAGSPWTVAAYMVEGSGSRDWVHPRTWLWRDPAGFGRLLDLLVEATARYLSAQVAAGAQALMLFDSWAGALAETQFWQAVIAPTEALVRRLKRAHPNVPVIGFPRGAGALLSAYVAHTGVDAVQVDAGQPLATLAGLGVPVQGNLDNLALLAGGEALDRQVLALRRALAGRPHVVNLGHGILPETPPEHVARLAELLRAPLPAIEEPQDEVGIP